MMYVKQRRKLGSISFVLESFLFLNKKYYDLMDQKDCAFIYTENSNVSMLAAAAWHAGWLAICEFQHVKKSKEDGRRRSYGRCDLYLYDPVSSYEYHCEAKTHFLVGTKKDLDWEKVLIDKMKFAKADLERTCAPGQDRGLAVSFFALYTNLTKNSPSEATLNELKSFLSGKPKNFDAVALYELENPIKVPNEGRQYLGCLMTIQAS